MRTCSSPLGGTGDDRGAVETGLALPTMLDRSSLKGEVVTTRSHEEGAMTAAVTYPHWREALS